MAGNVWIDGCAGMVLADWRLTFVIYVLGVIFFFVAFLMLCIVLLQEGKGGGLAAMGGAQTDSVMGARNPLRRWTVYFFVAFVCLVLGINYYLAHQAEDELDAVYDVSAAREDAAVEEAMPDIAVESVEEVEVVVEDGSAPSEAAPSDATNPDALGVTDGRQEPGGEQ